MDLKATRSLAIPAFAIALTLCATQTPAQSTAQTTAQTIDLPTSKQLIGPIPGAPERLNSLPVTTIVSPDHRYVVTVNAGFATFESGYKQSIAVLDTATGKLTDFPDDRTLVRAQQTLYSGLAFSADGKHLYASLASSTFPEGDGKAKTGSNIIVYSFLNGQVAPERLIPLPLVQLAPGHVTHLLNNTDGDKAIPFPSAIASLKLNGEEKLLVAGNLSDDVWLIDPATGNIEARFDLAENRDVPSTYPIAIEVADTNAHGDSSRAFVALWNSSEVVELDLVKRTVARKLALLKPQDPVRPGSHPCAIALDPSHGLLYVALANRDSVAALNIAHGQFEIKGYFDTRLPDQSYFGAEPVALALNDDSTRLFVANMATDSIAVFDPRKLTQNSAAKGMVEPLGYIPTEWMPMTVTSLKGKLYTATAKGHGTGPNNFPQRSSDDVKISKAVRLPFTYIATLLYGSLATIEQNQIDAHLKAWSSTVIESNRLKAAEEKINFAGTDQHRIKHVIYIIKENRTYDQILGDLSLNGKPVGNGDPSLTMFGSAVTPNEHKLALQFGLLDNFYDSGEVSGDGHVWSNAAIGTDYLEKTWEQNYRSGQRTYDFEGVVAEGLPLEQHFADVNEPASGYLWTNLASHNKTYLHFGEYIASTFCNAKKTSNPQQGPVLAGASCDHPATLPGEKLPAAWGGDENKWPWPIPNLAKNAATKPELVGHFAPEYPDFELSIPDNIRANILIAHLNQWIAARQQGSDEMPNFIEVRLGNDHTAGTRPGGPTPKASVADNDLAVGRIIDAVSHSPYWDDTAIFALEDDAQNGADHVDAHRSIALIASKYAPHGKDGAPFIDSRFYSTVSVIRTMETLLSLPPMNNNDAFSSLISTLFSGPGDQPPYVADDSNRVNGLIYTANTKDAVGGMDSIKMNFKHPDQADPEKLNVILWKDTMGNQPVPAMIHLKPRTPRKDNDD